MKRQSIPVASRRRRSPIVAAALLALSLLPLAAGLTSAHHTASHFLVTQDGVGGFVSTSSAETYTGTLKAVVESATASLNAQGGGTVEFAAGDFDLGGQWFKLVRIANITFAGQGIDVTTIRNSTDVAADTEPFNTTDTSYVVISDMTIVAGGSARTTSDAIDFDNGNHNVVERVKITASRGRAIVFDGKNKDADGTLWTADHNVVRDCVISGVRDDGIQFLASSDNRVENCSITNVGGDGISMVKSSTIADQPNKTSSNNVIVGNDVHGAFENGIKVNGGNGNQITDNIVTNSSQNPATNLDGIRVSTTDSIACDNTFVDGNTATDDQVVRTQTWGLNIGSPLCNGTVIGANDLGGNLNGKIHDLGTGTIYASPEFVADGFENGLRDWTNQADGLVVQSSTVLDGALAVRSVASGTAAWAYQELAPTESEMHYRAWFRIASHGTTNVNLLGFRTSQANGAASLLRVFVSGTNRIGYANDFAGGSATNTAILVSLGAWHEVQAHVFVAGASSRVDVWLDGAAVSGLSNILDLGTQNVGRLQLGESSTGRTYDVAFDEVAAQPTFIASSAPQTVINSGPTGSVSEDFATFAFSSPVSGTFECALDGGAFAACTTPIDYTGLADASHSFQVRAVNGSGVADPTPATRTWTVEATAPSVTSVNPTDGASGIDLVANVTAIFSESIAPATLSGTTFSLSGDGGSSFVAASVTYDEASRTATLNPTSQLLANTLYTATVAGGASGVTDVAGNPLAAEVTWSFTTATDLTAPDTTIQSGPSDPTNATGATFTFSSDGDEATFACSLDAAPFSDCASPEPYLGLSDGSHSFAVAATDAQGNVDASPATWAWTVDTAAPDTSITSAPESLTNTTTASFDFSSADATATFECSLDGSAFTTCLSPKGYSGLGTGNHTFAVRAGDAAGNADASPASASWTVDATAPSAALTAPASGASLTGVATLSATASDNLGVNRVEFLVDGVVVATDTTSPYSVSWNSASLSDGSKTIVARAVDTAGNGAFSESLVINLENYSPDTVIDSGPSAVTASTTATFSFHSTEAGSTFACRLDGGTFKNCTSPKNYGGLSQGNHTLLIRATDASGKTDATPATWTWRVGTVSTDTTAPSGVAITAPQNGATVTATVTITATASDNVGVTRVELYVDGLLFGTDTSAAYSFNWNTRKVLKGPRALFVRAYDAAGNMTQSATTTVTVN